MSSGSSSAAHLAQATVPETVKGVSSSGICTSMKTGLPCAGGASVMNDTPPVPMSITSAQLPFRVALAFRGAFPFAFQVTWVPSMTQRGCRRRSFMSNFPSDLYRDAGRPTQFGVTLSIIGSSPPRVSANGAPPCPMPVLDSQRERPQGKPVASGTGGAGQSSGPARGGGTRQMRCDMTLVQPTHRNPPMQASLRP